MIWVVFLAISTAPGILGLAILAALLRGISHDVFADEDDEVPDKYEALETRPLITELPTSALAAALPPVKSGAPFPPWVSRPPL